MPLVPVRPLLIRLCDAENCCLIKAAARYLQTERQPRRGEAAGHRNRWQAGIVEWAREAWQFVHGIRFQFRFLEGPGSTCRSWRTDRDDLTQDFSYLLDDLGPRPLSLDVVGSA